MLEYAENGSLQNYLRKRQPGAKNTDGNLYTNVNSTVVEIKGKQLIRWSYEIAKGMEFLAMKSVRNYLYEIS